MRRFYFKIILVHVFLIAIIVFTVANKSLLTPLPIAIGEITNIEPMTEVGTELSSSTASMSAYFVGDIMLARHVEYLMSKHGNNYPFENLAFLKHDSDFVVGNFEAAVPKVHQKTPNFGFSFSVDKKYLPNLSLAGFTHLSLANNHSYDKGIESFINTKEVLAKYFITTFGSPRELATSSVAYLEKDGLKVALVGLYAVDIFPAENEISDLVKQIDTDADYLVAYIHWGIEYQELPGIAVEQLANMLSKAGFHIIIGHHPHVTQSIKIVNNSLVFYSLGNFIFDQYFSREVQEGLVLKLDFQRETTKITLLPITSLLSSAQPRLMDKDETSTYLASLAKISSNELQSQILEGEIDYEKILATSSEIAIMSQ